MIFNMRIESLANSVAVADDRAMKKMETSNNALTSRLAEAERLLQAIGDKCEEYYMAFLAEPTVAKSATVHPDTGGIA